MTNGTTEDRRPAWRALVGIDEADAYLRALPDQEFIKGLRAEWLASEKHPYTAPASTRDARRFVTRARGYARKLRASCQPGAGPRLNAPEGVRRWLDRLASVDLNGPLPVANPVSAEVRRLMVVKDPKLRLARSLALRAAADSRDDVGSYRVTGTMAAVLSVALGVESPVRRYKDLDEKRTKDLAEKRIKDWNKRAAGARVQFSRIAKET